MGKERRCPPGATWKVTERTRSPLTSVEPYISALNILEATMLDLNLSSRYNAKVGLILAVIAGPANET